MSETKVLTDSERLQKLLDIKKRASKKLLENKSKQGKAKIITYFVDIKTRDKIYELVKLSGNWQKFFDEVIEVFAPAPIKPEKKIKKK